MTQVDARILANAVRPQQPVQNNPLQTLALGTQIQQSDRRLGQQDRALDLREKEINANNDALSGDAKTQAARLLPSAILETIQIAERAPAGTRVAVFNNTLMPILDRMQATGTDVSQLVSQFRNLREEDLMPGTSEKFSNIVREGVDAQGNPIFFQASDQGGVRELPGVTPAQAGPSSTEVSGIRKELSGKNQNSVSVLDSYGTLESSLALNTGAGDIAGVFTFMKTLDPRSVVREGEFATAENAAGIPSQVRNLYNKLLDGERLSPEARADLLSAGRALAQRANETIGRNNEIYRGIADERGIPGSQIFTDRARKLPQKDIGTELTSRPIQGTTVGGRGQVTEGTIIENAQGERMIYRNGSWVSI